MTGTDIGWGLSRQDRQTIISTRVLLAQIYAARGNSVARFLALQYFTAVAGRQ